MAKTLTPPEALHRSAALCSSSEHCIADIREKLSRWGIGEPDARTIVERLVQERFIDEGRYAIAFAKDKFRFRVGTNKIRYALQQKRIGNSDIVNALSLIDEEAYTTRLADLLEKKSRSINDEDVEVRRSKLLRFAASRGFETELVFRIQKKSNHENAPVPQRFHRFVLSPALPGLSTGVEQE